MVIMTETVGPSSPREDPRITNEAVMAAAKAVSLDWQNFVPGMRAALEAALPHLAPQPVSDQCLRDALEKICDDYIAIDIGLLRETLAAHPVEPSPPRPVVDRLALGDVVAEFVADLYRAQSPDVIAKQCNELTDAVLALLNGEAK